MYPFALSVAARSAAESKWGRLPGCRLPFDSGPFGPYAQGEREMCSIVSAASRPFDSGPFRRRGGQRFAQALP